MIKRITALLICAALLISMLAGCSSESAQNPTVPASEAAPAQMQSLLPESFTNMLNNAVILLTGSDQSYIRGHRALVEDALPVQLGSVLYVPAAFVAESIGAEVTGAENKMTVVYRDTTIEITPEALHINGTPISLPMGNAFTEQGVLVPAQEYCQSLGMQLHNDGGLILIGDSLTEGLSSASPDQTQQMMSALRSDLTPTMDMAVQADGSYADRTAVSACLALNPLDFPYSTEQDTLVAYAGNLYVDNLTIDYSEERQSHIISMTVYNYLGYCYGSVEVYDREDNLRELELIPPYSGQKASVVSAITDVAQLAMDTGKAIWNWDIGYLNYRTDLNSSKTEITVEVPQGGYIFITCNPTHSVYAAMYNLVYAFVQTAVYTVDTGNILAGGGDSTADTTQKLVDYITKKLSENPGVVMELAAEFERIFGGNSTVLDSNNYLSSTAEALLDAFARSEIDIQAILTEAIQDQLADCTDQHVENFLTAVLPVTEVALTNWKIISNSANLINTFLDMKAVCKCKSIIIEISDWRTAYVEFLKDYVNSGDRYDLLYLTRDNLPELVILHAGGRVGSSATVYTYQNRQVINIPGPYGPEIPMGFGEMQYLEHRSSIIQGNIYEGETFMSFMVIQDGEFQEESLFQDTELRDGGVENAGFGSYYYNGFPVPQSLYYWMLWNIGIYNEGDVTMEKYPVPLSTLFEKAKYVSAYTSGWEITDIDILEIYLFGQ